MVKLIVYGRRNCHLCDVAKDAVALLRREVEFMVEERDVDDNDAWARAYGDEVPVGVVDGRKVFKYRVDTERLRRALSAIPAADPTPAATDPD